MAGDDTAERRDEVRRAIEGVARAAQADDDGPRGRVAAELAARFADVGSPRELRDEARRALQDCYRGGMGSFQDWNTAGMATAGDALWDALNRATRARG